MRENASFPSAGDASSAGADRAATGLPPGLAWPSLAQFVWFLRDRMGMLEACRRRFGDVFTVRFPWQTLVFIADPALVKEIFTGDPDVLHAGRGNDILRPLLGDSSLLLLDGGEHLRQRRLLLPPFHGQRMRTYGDLIRDVTLEDMASWPRGSAFPVHPRMQEITLSVIMRAVFGMEEGAAYSELHDRLRELLEQGARAFIAMLPFFQFELGGLSPYGRLVRRMREIDDLLYREIERRRSEGGLEARSDVLSLLLQAVDEEGRPMTPKELRDELMTLLVAGHETSATSLAWCFYYVLKHPEVHAKVREELRRIYGEGPVTPERLNDLEYLEATIQEVSRLQPILV
ncbi:MAG: cytochrome P450, partial [Candidatus Binatia bacterium]